MLTRNIYLRFIRLSWRTLILLTFGIVVLSTFAMHHLEPTTFATYFDSLWFTMTTVLTVGYGDLFPKTVEGKLFTILVLYVFGIGLFATTVGKLFDQLSDYRNKRKRGALMFTGKNHVVIVDWSRKAQHAATELVRRDPDVSIVIIDTKDEIELPSAQFHYVRGDASLLATIQQAAVEKASRVLIFADDDIHEANMNDGRTLLIATAMERYAPQVKTTVEICQSEHKELFSHVKVDHYIVSDEVIAQQLLG